MEGITISEMAEELGIASDTVKRRLQRKGLNPFRYIGNAGIYKKSDLAAIREGGKRGRPKAETPNETVLKSERKKKKENKTP